MPTVPDPLDLSIDNDAGVDQFDQVGDLGISELNAQW
jgi:hypothetical protein